MAPLLSKKPLGVIAYLARKTDERSEEVAARFLPAYLASLAQIHCSTLVHRLAGHSADLRRCSGEAELDDLLASWRHHQWRHRHGAAA